MIAQIAQKCAVTAIVADVDGHVAMMLRDEKPGLWAAGYWALFGGQVEPGESLSAAILRELQEELCINPDYLRPMGVVQEFGDWVGAKPSVVFQTMVTRAMRKQARLREGQALCWMNKEEVGGLAYAGHPILEAHAEAVRCWA